jgi:hypothetical protein
MRSFLLLVAAVGALALGVPAALATTASDTEAGITVTVSLSDTATAGQPFTVAESIANSNPRARLVLVNPDARG